MTEANHAPDLDARASLVPARKQVVQLEKLPSRLKILAIRRLSEDVHLKPD